MFVLKVINAKIYKLIDWEPKTFSVPHQIPRGLSIDCLKFLYWRFFRLKFAPFNYTVEIQSLCTILAKVITKNVLALLFTTPLKAWTSQFQRSYKGSGHHVNGVFRCSERGLKKVLGSHSTNRISVLSEIQN